MLSLYAIVFVILLLTHSATCYAGYSQGLSRGKLRGRLEEKREHVNFLKELDERWNSATESDWDEILSDHSDDDKPKNYKDLN